MIWLTFIDGLAGVSLGSKEKSTPRSGYDWPRISPSSLQINTGWTLLSWSCCATVLAGKALSKRMMIDTTLPPLQLASTR